jgi:hypothetical protein
MRRACLRTRLSAPKSGLGQYVHEVKVMVVLERRANATSIDGILWKGWACHLIRHRSCMERVDEINALSYRGNESHVLQ